MVKTIIILLIFFLLSTQVQNVFASSEVFINEAMANPNEGEGEWVEFYFPNDYFDLAGYYLKDAKDNKKNIVDVQTCGQYAVFELSEGTGWLNNREQESVSLYSQDNNRIDSRNGKDPGKGKSLGRTPDGAENWNETESPTKCAANGSQKSQASESTNQSTPTPSPSPSQSNPSPASSSKSKTQQSPQTSTQNTKKTAQVLGQKTTASPSTEPVTLSVDAQGSPSPSPSPSEAKSISKTAGIVIGVGAIALAASLLVFLWYRWEIKSTKTEEL